MGAHTLVCLLGPVLMSLKPGSQIADSCLEMKGLSSSLDARRSQSRPALLQLAYIQDKLETKEDGGCTDDGRSRTPMSNGEDLALCSPPRTENEVLNEFVVTNICYLCTVFKLAVTCHKSLMAG